MRNLARQKFIAHFVISPLKSRKVQFFEAAQYLNDAVKPASNQTKGKLRLCLGTEQSGISTSAKSIACC